MYRKEDATMTRGLAIICMINLHLFCRQGSDVFGTPLFWMNDSIPFIYLLGFFSEICVTLYSIVAGYARQLSVEKEEDFIKNIMRICRLLLNYWIILILFSLLGILFKSPNIPGNFPNFVKSIFLLHSYNGAWWYLNSYIIITLLPAKYILYPAKKLNAKWGLLLCFILSIALYGIDKWFLNDTLFVHNRLYAELINLLTIYPAYLSGAILRKNKIFDKLQPFISCRNSSRHILTYFMVIFLFNSFFQKSRFIPVIGIIVFLLFNMWSKPTPIKKIFTFIGMHSTNIWLTHMFFYNETFDHLVLKARYPLLIFLLLMLICILCSIFVTSIRTVIEKSLFPHNKNCFR